MEIKISPLKEGFWGGFWLNLSLVRECSIGSLCHVQYILVQVQYILVQVQCRGIVQSTLTITIRNISISSLLRFGPMESIVLYP